MIVQRGGSCGTGSVNVSAGQSFPAHFIRRLTRQKSVSCPQARTSRGVTVTYWCTFSETVPQPGHIAGRVILAQTVSRPPAPRSASVTSTPSIPNSTDAVSWAGAGPLFSIVTNQDLRARTRISSAPTRGAM